MSEYKCHVEICYVIEATKAMADSGNVVEQICEQIRGVDRELYGEVGAMGRDLILRQRLITYSDFLVQGDKAIVSTPFYDGAGQGQKIVDALRAIDFGAAKCGRVNALEALCQAIKSDWKVPDPYNYDNPPADNHTKYFRYIVLVEATPYWALNKRLGCCGRIDKMYPTDINAIPDMLNDLRQAGPTRHAIVDLVACLEQSLADCDIVAWENTVSVCWDRGFGMDISLNNTIAEMIYGVFED